MLGNDTLAFLGKLDHRQKIDYLSITKGRLRYSLRSQRALDEYRRSPMQQQTVPAFAIFDDYRPTVTITVLIRWLLLSAWLAMANYRVEHDSTWVVFNSMGAALGVANAYLTWRITTG
jgi:hypothetical protein